MKIGRVRSEDGIHTVIVHNGKFIKLSSVLNLSEDEIEHSFYHLILENRQKIVERLNEEGDLFDTASFLSYGLPMPCINSIRDFYAFENHVKRARERRGLPMVEEWYEIPTYYYSGTANILPAREDVPYPSFSSELDYELEIGIIIGKEGKNIKPMEAMNHVFGLVLMNDWSARDLQRKEMKIGLGPSKSKDFATSIGPYVVTMDEIVGRIDSEGKIDIKLWAEVNGKRYSEGNLNQIYWSLESLISWASTETELKPGDILMTGTVGTGCILELGPEKYGWLRNGDTVELFSDVLGELRSKVV